MTVPVQPAQSPLTVRIIHGAMGAGLVLFAIVAHFILKPNRPPYAGGLDRLLPMLLGLSLGLCVGGILLSMRVPRPLDDETAGAFWRRAAQPALVTWALIEGAGILAVVLYAQTGSTAAIAVAIVAVVIFGLLNPGYFERRN